MTREKAASPLCIRILLAEDDKHVGWLLKMLLEEEGFAVTWVECGQSAVVALQAADMKAYDVLVTDLYMPNLDGVGLVDWVCEQRPALPILVITATQSDAILARQSEGKVKAIYQKPMTDTLIDRFVADIQAAARAV